MGRREEHALKQLLRITILLIGLIWILAWAAAGRFDDTPNTQDGSESPLPSGEIAAPGERDSAKTLRVQIQGEVQEMDMGTYLLGVLRAEMPASFEEEALKAQAIAARTYTLYRIRGGGSANHPDADACDDHTCCKAYINAEQAAANWGSMAVYYEEKLARAVSETDGEVILYDGAPILAVFFSSADGSTQGAGDVWMNDLPYLQKVDSPETEELVPNYYSVATFTAAEFKSLVLAAKPDADLSGSPEGKSKRRAFWTGVLSGAVEPLFGALVVLAAAGIHALMPWLLSFAAGAMLYVVAEELLPRAGGRRGTCGFLVGFLLMMILDVALG